MECFEVDTKIISYLEDTLDDDELEAFLEHLDECEDCRNEAALYFTLMEGLKQMDEDEIQIFDYQTEFQRQRKERLKDVILRKRYRILIDRLVILFVIAVIIAGLIWGFFQKQESDSVRTVQEDYYEQQISID